MFDSFLNMLGVLNMPGSEYASTSKHVRVLNIPGFWICLSRKIRKLCFLKYETFFRFSVSWNTRKYFVFRNIRKAFFWESIRNFFRICVSWNIRNFFLNFFNISAKKFYFPKYKEFFQGFRSFKFFNIRARKFYLLKYKEFLGGGFF